MVWWIQNKRPIRLNNSQTRNNTRSWKCYIFRYTLETLKFPWKVRRLQNYLTTKCRVLIERIVSVVLPPNFILRFFYPPPPTGWTTEGLEFESRWGKKFSLLQIIQTSSEVHPASYPMGTGGSFPGLKRQGREVDHSNSCRGQENVDLYIHSNIRLHGVVLN
jgi:hypothetical protein